MAFHSAVVSHFRDIFHSSDRHAREGGFSLWRHIVSTKDNLGTSKQTSCLSEGCFTVALDGPDHDGHPIALEVAVVWKVFHTSAQKFESGFCKFVLLQSCSNEVSWVDGNCRRHFLAEGFGKVFEIDPEFLGHLNICTICRASADLVDPRGIVTELLVDVGASDKLAGVRGSDPLQLIGNATKQDARNLIVVCVDHHGIFILRKVVIHEVGLDIFCGFGHWLCQARSCLRLTWSVRHICSARSIGGRAGG